MNKYYIYAHITKDTGEIFYIGKGSGKRIDSTYKRNDYWNRIVNKHGYTKIKLFENLEEEQAFIKEVECISLYKDKGLCKANISLGGDGVRVDKRWWGDKISQAMKGKATPKGKLNKSYKNLIGYEELKKLYIDDKKNTTEIAKIIGVSIPTVCSRLKEFNLQTRNSGRKKVSIICTNDGNIFESIMDAARFYGVYRENIKKVLDGKYTHTNKLIFKYETT